MIGASAALMLARVPFFGPVGAIRLGRVDGQLVAFPTAEELEESDLDLIVSSTEKAIVMIEGFGEELPEPEMGDAIMEAHRLNQELIALQKELIEAVGLPPLRASRSAGRPAAADDLRALRRRAPRGQADRDEGRAEQRDAMPCRIRSSRSWSRARRVRPAPETGESSGDPAPSPVPADAGSPRGESRRPSARSKSGSCAS